ncbi:MAG: NAD-dependent deacylase, partial [Pseudomonadota bacterium]|nr:NAD-dependent deacylase [Pseudomonadota bacterium]
MTSIRETNIFILTGAGISKESGLDTFRDSDGIWSKIRLEDVATPEAFLDNPAAVQEFYNSRRKNLIEEKIAPNRAHFALADLERRWPSNVTIVTQNIDNLHEMAGSKNLIHMHGELLKARCLGCQKVSVWNEDLGPHEKCPYCDKVGFLRPHVVWFGETPLEMPRIMNLLSECGLFISIGTSGNVYPAAGFARNALNFGATTIEINLEPSEGKNIFSQTIYGPATEKVPQFIEKL